MSLDEKILSLALNDKKFAMELTSSTTHRYYSPDLKWLFVAINHYFTDPNIKSIPTADMIAEYVVDNASKHVEIYNRIKSTPANPDEFSWLLEKMRLRFNDQLQKETRSKIDELIARTPVSPERIEEINKLIKQSVVDIDSIRKQSTYKEGSLRNSAVERAKRYEYIEKHPEVARGILTGFSTLDSITNGIHPGEFMLIAGDTGTGKSVLLHNMAVNAYLGKNNIGMSAAEIDDSGANVLYFSLEMPKEVQERRIDACMAEVYSKHIRDGLLDAEEKKKYMRVLKFQKNYHKNFHIVDMPKGVTSREIELKFLEICESSFKPDLVVVDYLGIMSPNDQSGSDWMDLGVISAELHEFGRVYDVSTLSASQVNRTKDGAERYDTSRIARSGMIPNNANIIIQIGKRPDEDLRTDMPIYITKMRDGEKGQFTLNKDFAKMKVVDIVDSSYADDDDDDIV